MTRHVLTRYLFASILALLFCSGTAYAQLPGPVGADSLSRVILPVFGYSSDTGLAGGALFTRIDYRGNTEPYRSFLESSAVISTKGYVQVGGTYERTRTFGRDIRSTARLFVDRLATANFFGLGNDTPFSKGEWEEGYYYFDSVGFGLEYLVRTPLLKEDRSQLDFNAGVGADYHIAYAVSDDTRFQNFRPNGHGGGYVTSFQVGLIWENRDSEFDPTDGNRADLTVRYAPAPFSAFHFAAVRFKYRLFFQLFDRVTVANRLEARHAGGDVPYWEQSGLGDEYTLRGYPLNRFQGKGAVSYTLELRSWLLELPLYRFRLGGQLFTDTGRVFTGADDVADLFGGYKQTWGFGGAMSVFNPDIILRGEIGFSEDMSRIYLGIGYAF